MDEEADLHAVLVADITELLPADSCATRAMLAVLELHKPIQDDRGSVCCREEEFDWPCSTWRAVEYEFNA